LVYIVKYTHIIPGNYSVRTNIIGSDEIAATAEAFNLMAESIEQYDSMKSKFFIDLSHELKTPINVIYSCVQLMESFKKSTEPVNKEEKFSKNITVIKQNCFRLMRLIGNLIDAAKFESGYLKVNPLNCDIVSLVGNISLSVVRFAEQKNITVIFDTNVEEKVISCDGDMIERIMLNLKSNSLKFTDEGGFIYINLYDEGEKIKITVKDTGIGIPEDKRQIIFDRFRQVDSSLNRNQEGSGLGLSIVKSLVAAHEGSITVESELTKGSVFIVNLPAKLLAQTKETPTELGHDGLKETVQKIAVEFSDIYSIDQHNL
jgi:signal transduction histidine kinase